MLTIEQLQEIRAIIETYHQAFIISAVGPDFIPKKILEKLKKLGLSKEDLNSAKEAYLYGQLVASTSDPKIAKMDYDAFKQHIRENPIPLSAAEKRAVEFAQYESAQLIHGLGNKISTQTGKLMIDADTKLENELKGIVRDVTAQKIARRETNKQLKSELGWATKDWARDWDRIAITESHAAHQKGVADHYSDRYGPDVRVAKVPTPDACEHCKRLHLGPDDQPRIFKLSSLEANGTNYGRKANAWQAVVGPVHPHCQCQLVRIPPNWGFDEEGQLVPGGGLGVSYEDEIEAQKAMIQEQDLMKAYALQGHVEFQGLDIAIENKPGSKRHWKTGDGESGTTTMIYAYGYIKNTKGNDEDEVDVYMGPDPRATHAYIISQQDPKTGRYDEDKIMLGFSSEAHARLAYQWHYNRPDFFQTIIAMEMDAFKRWIRATDKERLHKSGEKFFIPLEKAALMSTGNLSADSLVLESGRAAFRNPGPGTMMNYVVGTKPKKAEPTEEDNKNMVRDFLDDKPKEGIKRDKEDYIFDNPADRTSMLRTMEVDVNIWGEGPTGEEVAKQREGLEIMDPHGWRLKGYKNKAELDEEIEQ